MSITLDDKGFMAGTFRVDSTFVIRGHGLFLRGQMTAGSVSVGGVLAITGQQGEIREERITRVDAGNGADAAGRIQRFLGLQLGGIASADISALQMLLKPGLELQVADPQPG